MLRTLGLVAAVTLLLGSTPASAQASRWRRGDARSRDTPQSYALELRFGPYVPRIDDDFPGRGPFASVFGTDRRLAVGLEFDWQVLRIPLLGTLGPGLGWSYTRMSAPAVFGNNEPSAETTGLSIMPMYAVGVLRVDVLARETPIPLVAYGKAGLGYGLWWSGNDSGPDLRGRSWGRHLAVGGMLLLDVLDERAATVLDNEVGINNTYFFFEWMDSRLGSGFSNATDRSVLRIGTSTWIMGLAFEM